MMNTYSYTHQYENNHRPYLLAKVKQPKYQTKEKELKLIEYFEQLMHYLFLLYFSTYHIYISLSPVEAKQPET